MTLKVSFLNFFFLVLIPFSAFAQINVDTEISQVMVYKKGAKITRTATVNLKNGLNEFVFSNLYHAVQGQTVQLKIDDQAVSVMDVSFHQNYLKNANVDGDVQALEDSLKSIPSEMIWNRQRKEILDGEEAIIKANNRPKTKEGVFEVADLRDLTEFYRGRMLEIRREAMLLNEAHRDLKTLQSKLQKQINEKRRGSKVVGEVKAKVFAQNPRKVDLEISYFIYDAGWTPYYDLKSSKVGEPVEMVYRGAIRQKTGIEWKNVQIVLSSAQPAVNNTHPNLQPNLITIEPTYQVDTVLTFDPEAYEEQVQVVRNDGINWSEEDNTATSFQFTLLSKYDIPSDGKDHFVTIKNINLPADYEYYTVPKKENAAFLLANVTDFGKYQLLPGRANLFFEGTYLGKAYINSDAVKDTLNISLGRDLEVSVQREKRKYTAPRLIGNNVRESFEFVIKVRNNKEEPIEMKVKDQIPISTHKGLEVKLTEKSQAKFIENSGFLIWDLKLKPNETKELTFGYTLKYPKEKKVWVVD